MPVLIAPLVAAAGLTGTAASVATFAGSVAAGVGFALISQMLVPAEKPAGGKREKAVTGSSVPRCMLFGRVATAGAIVYDNVYGADDRQLQIVTAIADHRCKGIVAAVIDGKTKGVSNYTGGGYQKEINDYSHRFQFNFVEGTESQTASNVLTSRANPSSRWSSSHRLRSICHVISHLEYREKEFPGMAPPQVMWVVEGGYWYDPRKDSTQSGGSGSHRWNNKSTWEYSENPYVALYNYLRGLWVNGELWVGAGLDDADLDLDAFMAAMDVCDDEVENPDGSFSPRYSISLIAEGGRNANHRKVLDAVRLATAGEVAIRRGKIWVAAGVPRSPVVQITDADIMPNTAIRYTPKRPAGGGLLNEAYGTFLAETAEWSQKDLTPYIDETARTNDGQRLDVGIDFTMVRDKWQALRLLKYTVQRSRYQASAKITVRPYLIGVEAGDIIEWTSARFGFTKAFIVKEWEDQDAEMLQAVWTLQEIDAIGFTGPGDGGEEEPPDPPGPPGEPFAPANFQANAHYIVGDLGNRKAGALCTWTPPDDESIIGMVLQIRREGATVYAEDSVDQYELGERVTTSGIGPASNYEIRASYRRDSNPLERIWTNWMLFYSEGDTSSPGDTTPPAVVTGLNFTYTEERLSDLSIHYKGQATWDPNTTDSDLRGYDISITRTKDSTGADIIGAEPIIVPVLTNRHEWDLLPGTTVIRVRAVDKSGNASSYTTQRSLTITADGTPPGIPSGFTVTQTPFVATDGSIQTRARASWNEPADEDLDSYEIEIDENSAGGRIYRALMPRFDWNTVPGIQYACRVRSVDTSGNRSGYTSTITVTGSSDTGAPGTPTGLVAVSALKGIVIRWDSNTEADLDRYQWLSRTTNTTPGSGTAPTAESYSNFAYDAPLDYGQTRYYWVRAVDTTGNKSPWSSVASATSGGLGSADIIAKAVGDVALADNAVVARTIAAQSITASKLLLTDLTNMVRDPGFVEAADVSTWRVNLSSGTANGTLVPFAFSGAAYPNAATHSAETTALVDIESAPIQIEVGKPLWVNGYIGAYNTALAAETYRLLVRFYSDVTGTTLVSTSTIGTYTGSSRTRISGLVDAPSTARSCRIVGRKDAGVSNRPLFAEPIIRRAANAELIVDGSIYTRHLVADQIEAQHIKTDQLEARHIKAGEITTDKLRVRSKFLVVNPDPLFEDPQVWEISTDPDLSIPSSNVQYNSRFLLCTVTKTKIFTRGRFQIDPQKNYFIELVYQRATGDRAFRGIWQFYNGANVALSATTGWEASSGTEHYWPSNADAPSTAAQRLTMSFGPAQTAKIPSGANYLEFGFTFNRTSIGTTAGSQRVQMVRVVEYTTGELIVEGTIQARHLAVDSIEADKIKAGAISAEKMTLSMRGINFEGLRFEANHNGSAYALNRVSWTAATVRYVNDSGVLSSQAISAGNALWSSGTLYIYWQIGATTLASTTSASDSTGAFMPTRKLVAAYKGGLDLVQNFGSTIIDGSFIKTGSITAEQIDVDTITADKIKVGSFAENLIPDPSFENGPSALENNWEIGGVSGSASVAVAASSDTKSGRYRLVMNRGSATATVSLTVTSKQYIPVVGGGSYYFEFLHKGSGISAAGAYLRIFWYDDNDGSAALSSTDVYSNGAIATSWQTRSSAALVAAPTAARYAKVRVQHHSSSSIQTMYVDNVVMRRELSGVIIQDGTVIAEKLNVSSLSAITANLGTVTTGRILSTNGKLDIDARDGQPVRIVIYD